MKLKNHLLLVVYLLALLPLTTKAQVNIEKYRRPGHENGLAGYVKFDVSSRTGNVDVTVITLEGSADFKWKKMDSFIIAQGDKGWQNNEQFSNEGLLHFRQIFTFKPAWQPETFVQTDFNKQRLVTDRKLAGIGIRTTIYRNGKNSLVCGTSYMLEYEKLNLADNGPHPRITRHQRWNNYLALHCSFSSHLQGYCTTYYQPRFDAFHDLRFLSEASLKIIIIKPVSIAISYRIRYDSAPPPLIDKTDGRLTTGIMYVF